MAVVHARVSRAVGVDSAYSAFPSVCRFPSGVLRLVWRQGSNHAAARDGVVRTSVSTDGGLSWGTPSTALAAAGFDLRDPCVATSGGVTWLTYFKGTASLPAAGAFVRGSLDDGVTWSAEVRIDAQPYAAICAPVVDLGGGTVVTAYYGRDTGDAVDSCWLATSADSGATWTRRLVADGPAFGQHFQEPWVVARGSDLCMFFRYGTHSAIGVCTSADAGLTWTPPVPAFPDATGRPAAVWLESGAMAVVYRRISDRQAVVRTRAAGAAVDEWLPARRLGVNQPTAGPIGMQYAHPLVVPDGVFCAVGIEGSATSSRLCTGWLHEGAGISPHGDLFPDEQLTTAADLDGLLVADSFARPDGPLTWPWHVGLGGMRITDGYAVSTTADNAPDLAWQDVGSTDVDLSGDFLWTGQAGYGLLARVVTGNTYLMLTVESSGAALRLYRVNSGTATQIASVAVQVPASTWARLRMELRGARIQCFLNGQALVAHTLTAGEQSDFLGRGSHGIKLNAQGAGVHRCRRFTVRT